MKEKVVVIGASSDAIHAITVAREMGLYVIAFDGNAEAEGLSYADEAVHFDISNADELCKRVHDIDPVCILPIPLGRQLSVVGKINEALNLPGMKSEAAEMSTDKWLFHQSLYKAGLRQVQCYLFHDTCRQEKLTIPFPAIMKPRFGSGSRGVYIIKNSIDLQTTLQQMGELQEDYILEELVFGDEYSLDGAVLSGQLEITLIRKKTITPLPNRQPIASIALSKIQYKDLYDQVYHVVRQAVNVLKYDDCLLNVDFIFNKGEVFLIEMAPRPSGHSIHSCFVPTCTGVDMIKEYIRYIMNGSCVMVTNDIKCQMIHFFDFNDVVADSVPEKEEIAESGKCHLLYWNCKIKNGDYLQNVTNGKSVMGRGFFIVQGEDEQDLLQQSEWILSQFTFK